MAAESRSLDIGRPETANAEKKTITGMRHRLRGKLTKAVVFHGTRVAPLRLTRRGHGDEEHNQTRNLGCFAGFRDFISRGLHLHLP